MQDQFDVAEVQRLLGVPADGELGPVTAAAIAAWKRSRGLRGEGLAPAESQRLLADVPLLAVLQMERWVGFVPAPGSSRPRSPSAATSFSLGISSTATLVDHVGRLVDRPVDGRVRTVDGNSGGDGLVALRDRANGSVQAFVRDS